MNIEALNSKSLCWSWRFDCCKFSFETSRILECFFVALPNVRENFLKSMFVDSDWLVILMVLLNLLILWVLLVLLILLIVVVLLIVIILLIVLVLLSIIVYSNNRDSVAGEC